MNIAVLLPDVPYPTVYGGRVDWYNKLLDYYKLRSYKEFVKNTIY